MKRFAFVVVSLGLILATSCAETAATFTVTASSLSVENTAFQKLLNRIIPSAFAETLSGSPTEFKMTIFRLFVSENEDCTSPVEVADLGSAGLEIDYYSNPTLFSVSPAAGTFSCIMIEANDQLSFKPDATAAGTFGGCTEGETANGEIYRDGEDDDGQWVDTAGAAIDATGDGTTLGTDKIVIFASTDEAAPAAGELNVHENQIVSLSSALVVPGSAVFYADFNDGVSGDATNCGLEGTEDSGFGFR